MTPSLEQLRTLLVVADQGSFSAAARHLGKAQSVVSSAIANLEIDLDLTLFDRSGRMPRLTPQGERILAEARLVMARCGELTALAGELAAGVEPRLTLAVDDDTWLPWLGDLLEAFSLRFPTVELELLFPLLEDLHQLLLSGRAQLGISYEQLAPSPDIVAAPLGRVTMPLVVAPSHPLAGQQSTTLDALQGSRQIMVTGRHDGQERQRFRVASRVWWAEGDMAVLELVRRGLGWASIPDVLVEGPLARGELVCLTPTFLAGPPAMSTELLWHRARPLGQAGRWLKEALQARTRGQGEEG
ncbi:LysR family transcriptional regulator [Aeromonas schubertii]|uniref:LysR family transcriptional regulator n=2 Tax=Aeromonas schubertii TaxID=652 RepID=A0A0S2SK72_9GAMM|nr:LysR family transcriptional regulator [Aeromonas schubertii]ALP42120.1 Regulatory protein [Aeromonas schubertii]MBZ6066477.1 LysR family transcriptional regulator [Aeromonas schubertii]MBZ6072958.1 LysR family transcriptional regulator [Aeromonas schubertii]QCG47119.1 LysR family transcriptional regulator [Aeromonas schubertii]